MSDTTQMIRKIAMTLAAIVVGVVLNYAIFALIAYSQREIFELVANGTAVLAALAVCLLDVCRVNDTARSARYVAMMFGAGAYLLCVTWRLLTLV